MSVKSARLCDVLNWMRAWVPERKVDDNELLIKVYERVHEIENAEIRKLVVEALTTLRARNDRLNKVTECWARCSERVLEAAKFLE